MATCTSTSRASMPWNATVYTCATVIPPRPETGNLTGGAASGQRSTRRDVAIRQSGHQRQRHGAIQQHGVVEFADIEFCPQRLFGALALLQEFQLSQHVG